jgi:hypothetical protein
VNFVMLYGPPGAGKLTVATELSRLTGYKLFDNHVSIDWAKAYFDFATEPFWRLVHSFREAVFEECARSGRDLIFTFVYAHPNDIEYVERRFEVIDRHDGRVMLVQMHCDPHVLLTRVDAADRVERGKLVDPQGLQDLLDTRELFVPIPGRESLRVDTTHMPPGEAARLIAGHFGLAVDHAYATE